MITINEYDIPGYGRIIIGKGTQRYVAHNEAGQMISFGNSVEEIKMNLFEVVDESLRTKKMKLNHDLREVEKGLELITNIPQLNVGGKK
jgi:hypothetical protein